MRTTYQRIKPEEAVGFPLLKQIANDRCILSIYANGFTFVVAACPYGGGDLRYSHDLSDELYSLTGGCEGPETHAEKFGREFGYKIVGDTLELAREPTFGSYAATITPEQVFSYNCRITDGGMNQAQAIMAMLLDGEITVKDARGLAWLSKPGQPLILPHQYQA